LAGKPLEEVSLIPTAAMIEQSFVYTVEDSLLVKKRLEVVSRGEKNVYARGLSGAELVVTQGVNSLYEGQKVGAKKLAL